MANWYLVRVYTVGGSIPKTAMISVEAKSPEAALTEIGRFVELYPIAESVFIYDDTNNNRKMGKITDIEAEKERGEG